MGWGGEAKTYLEVGTKLFELCIIKLPIIVCDDGVGDAEATYDILPDKRLDASCNDGPMRSSPHWSNGQGLTMAVNESAGS
ncbi:hypothetical protein L3X38_025558 [Prunus dulcis]|uniref:Uncharacterized protein n=1 Tax=Prunus dulcis TaxID=3755 RepID=A0AAD4Z759_PRUDU|nr:hypothetical protein L3X38_025558 [Prunus dulcis]